MITLDTELVKIKGLSEKFLERLRRLKIELVRDLLWHFPTRYEDFSAVIPVADLEIGQSATVSGLVDRVETRRTWRRKMTVIEAVIEDETGSVRAVWFNQPYIAQVLRPGMAVNLAGKVSTTDGELCFSNPAYEIRSRSGETKHTAGLIPIYPETRGLTSRGIRYLMKPFLRVLGNLPDWIPSEICAEYGVPPLSSALRKIHFPETLDEALTARHRFEFEELFLLHLLNLRFRSELTQTKAPSILLPPEQLSHILRALPFPLLPSQERSLKEILNDLQKTHPMNRLLQGDVGSGKTVVAALAALAAALRGYQAVFMAPTEILARQHYQTFMKFFGGVLGESGLSVALLTGSEARVFGGEGLERRYGKAKVLHGLAHGEIAISIGTHALIQQAVSFERVGLVVVDEQHRFGVKQRARLVSDQGQRLVGEGVLPHFLSMSATPIPRTLSLTVFGDLDLSLIEELPPGRKPTITKVVDPENRAKAYEFIRGEVAKGRQAFVICPRIAALSAEETEESALTDRERLRLEVKSVTEEYEKLSRDIFPALSVAMLHGKMKSSEKQAVMAGFAKGDTHILVSTSVVEVGVDIPNATIMVIEGADRFGLAQLYQFRGRIGRGVHQSYCLLFTDAKGDSVRRRLEALLKARNGFELAEQDLSLRGPGEFLGDRQTGLPDLAMRSLTNLPLIRASREAASKVMERSPDLSKRNPLLKQKLDAFQAVVHFE